MKTTFRDVKFYDTTCVRFVLLLLVLVFDMQANAQSETTIEPEIPTTCRPGYSPYPACNEFDECAHGTSRCEQKCTDTVENFTCSCNPGYKLELDGRSCADVDECKEKSSNTCDQVCSNTPAGSFTCSCTVGYRLAANGWSCHDIDECTDRSSGCKSNSYCHNTNGSYTCSCHAGYRLAADGRTCDDVNECANLVDNCTVPENSICENTVGSYRCVCKSGFEQVVSLAQCRDINECETFANNCTLYENTTCENIIGSYKCRPNDRGISEANKVAIAVPICLVAGLVLIVIAVVYFVRRAKERKINQKGPAKNNTVVASSKEHVYVNQAFDSAKTPRNQVSSEILYEECDDTRNQVSNPAAPQMEFVEIIYEDCSDVPVTNTKPKTKPETKPKPKSTPKPELDNLSTQEQCCSTNVSSSDPGDGETDPKEAATGKTILTNVHKGIQRIFKFKKASKDLQNGEATNDSIYQDLVRVPETNGVYEVIRKPRKAKKISVQ